MAPAVHQRPRSLGPLHAGEPVVTVIAVALQEAPPEAVEERLGMDATASRRISEQHDGRAGAALAPVIGDDGPQVRSERRRVGQEGVHTCRPRGLACYYNTKKQKETRKKT